MSSNNQYNMFPLSIIDLVRKNEYDIRKSSFIRFPMQHFAWRPLCPIIGAGKEIL